MSTETMGKVCLQSAKSHAKNQLGCIATKAHKKR